MKRALIIRGRHIICYIQIVKLSNLNIFIKKIEEYITSQCRLKRSPAIVAHWPGVLGIDQLGEAPVRVGIITSIIRHPVVIKEHATVVKKYNILAHVKWLQDHPHQNCLHDSVIISSNTYESVGPISFIPILRIIARCAICYS